MSRLLVLVTCVTLFCSVGRSAERMEFWDTPRKGTNCFNLIADSAWFTDATSAGISWVRLAYDKWPGEKRDFLIGDVDNYSGLIKSDLAKLLQVCDWADQSGLKVVITPLSLPGSRWFQHNNNHRDLRLWNDTAYWLQSVQFWRDLAAQMANHPAVVGYNILNEPIPETGTGLAEHGDISRYSDWYQRFRGTTHDLPAFYLAIIAGIREVDSITPIMLDPGWYAQPAAFSYWPKLDDSLILYAFHMYEPYEFTNHLNFKENHGYKYPGKIPFAGDTVLWDKAKLLEYFQPALTWADSVGIPLHHLVVSEFGCYRRNPGGAKYLADLISLFDSLHLHWAFYSFREDEWDGYDYELGTGPLGWEYWQAMERGEKPNLPRKDNPLFDVIKRALHSASQLQR